MENITEDGYIVKTKDSDSFFHSIDQRTDINNAMIFLSLTTAEMASAAVLYDTEIIKVRRTTEIIK